MTDALRERLQTTSQTARRLHAQAVKIDIDGSPLWTRITEEQAVWMLLYLDAALTDLKSES